MKNLFYHSVFAKVGVVVIAIGMLAISLSSAFAATVVGPNFAGTGATGGGSGAAWSNPSRVTADDNSYATALLQFTTVSESLNATNFGFSIPTSATINGVQVTIGRFASNSNSIQDNSVRLIKAGGVIGNNNGAVSTNWPTSEAAASYGAADDLWGTTWTPAQINASNFGVALVVDKVSGGSSSRTASVDYVKISVTYTPALSSQTITVTTHAPISGIYGSTFSVAATASSGLTVAITTTGGCSISGGTVTMTSGVTSCVAHYNQAGNGSYNPAPEVVENVTPQKKLITITADAKIKNFGAPDPVLTYQITSGSLVSGDSFSGSLARAAGEAAGAYAIGQGTLSAGGNYVLTYVGADLIIVSPNLVLNPSFELAGPANWSSNSWGSNAAIFAYPVEGAAGFGSKAARVIITSYPDIDPNIGGDAKWYFDDVAVVPGGYYVFSDQYHATTGSKIIIRYNMGDHYIYNQIGVLAPSVDWQTFTGTTIAPVGAVSMTVFHLIGSVGTLTVDDYSLVQAENPNAFSQGMVTLSFDDGWKSIYDNAISILNAAGLLSTQYIISGAIDNTDDGYMTAAEIQDMANYGHDISAHTVNHCNLETGLCPDAEVPNLPDPLSALQEALGSRLTLLSAGHSPVDSLAYPYGSYDASVQQVMRGSGFLGARSVDGGFNDKSTDRYALKVKTIERSTTLSEIQNAIDTAVASKTWLILVFHQIDNVLENIYGTTPIMMQNIADYLTTHNVVVKTISQGLQLMPGVFSNTDTIAPVIAAHSDITVGATSFSGVVVTYDSPAVSDNIDTELVALCLAPSGSTFPIGDTLITCKAADSSGNQAIPKTFTITVTPLAGLISGQKFIDQNGNGVKDDGEPGLSGWTVNLSGPVSTSTITDVNGNYSFAALSDGTYTVCEVSQDGWKQTLPFSGINCAGSTFGYSAVISGGNNIFGDDFGNLQLGQIIIRKETLPDGSAQSFSFAASYDSEGFLLTDGQSNESGFLNPGTYSVAETLPTGWDLASAICDDNSAIDSISLSAGETVTCVITNVQRGSITIEKIADPVAGPFIFDLSGASSSSVTFENGAFSNESNAFTFGSLAPGSYSIVETVPEGWSGRQSSECTSGTPGSLELVPGGSITCVFNNTEFGSISGKKFHDLNAAGSDIGKPGISGWNINLSGQTSTSTVTDENGHYLFTNILPGAYQICETLIGSWYQSFPGVGFSCENGTVGYAVTLEAGANKISNDFGNYQKGSISGIKFNDVNGNGVRDDGELGLEGWVINLFDGTATTTAYTNGGGFYEFTNLMPGAYVVSEERRDGWSQKMPADSVGYSINISSGTVSEDNNFGNFKDVAITGSKWNDFNGNGQKEEGEPGIEGWPVEIRRVLPGHYPVQNIPIDTELVQLSLTGADGVFTGIVSDPGHYVVTEQTQDGWQQTHPVESFFDIFAEFSGQAVDVGAPHGCQPVPLVTECQSVPIAFGNHKLLVINEEAVAGVDQTSAIIRWTTDLPGTSRVIYDTVSHSNVSITQAGTPNYGYAFSTIEDPATTTSHAVSVSNLSPGVTYYYRTISKASPESVGAEMSFQTQNSPAPSGISGGGGGGGGGSTPFTAFLESVATTNSSATVIWSTNYNSNSRVVYDTISHSTGFVGPNYGYAFSTPISDTGGVTHHSVIISDLSSAMPYYFRLISNDILDFSEHSLVTQGAVTTTTIPETPATGGGGTSQEGTSAPSGGQTESTPATAPAVGGVSLPPVPASQTTFAEPTAAAPSTESASELAPVAEEGQIVTESAATAQNENQGAGLLASALGFLNFGVNSIWDSVIEILLLLLLLAYIAYRVIKRLNKNRE